MSHKKEENEIIDICAYFNVILNQLFIDRSIMTFNGKIFYGKKLNSKKFTEIMYENIVRVKFHSFISSKKYYDVRPRKLDGTPDERYNQKIYANTNSSYSITFYLRKSNKKVIISYENSKNIPISKIKESLKKYNIFFDALKNNIKFKVAYKELLSIQKKCISRKKSIDMLKLEKQSMINIYNRLCTARKQFTEDQEKQFESIKQEIGTITDKISQEIEIVWHDINKEFDNIPIMYVLTIVNNDA